MTKVAIQLLSLPFVFLVTVPGAAQIDRSGIGGLSGGTVTNFRFAAPNELTITVSIIGAVKNPGRYEISRSINLLDLVALAGGWIENVQGGTANIAEVTVARFVTTAAGVERREIVFDLTERTAIRESFLTLQEGDFVYIPLSRAVDIDTILRWVTAVGVLVTTYFVIKNESNRSSQ